MHLLRDPSRAPACGMDSHHVHRYTHRDPPPRDNLRIGQRQRPTKSHIRHSKPNIETAEEKPTWARLPPCTPPPRLRLHHPKYNYDDFTPKPTPIPHPHSHYTYAPHPRPTTPHKQTRFPPRTCSPPLHRPPPPPPTRPTTTTIPHPSFPSNTNLHLRGLTPTHTPYTVFPHPQPHPTPPDLLRLPLLRPRNGKMAKS